jgi:quaternary ammonium compound-resistance protein SugE
MGWLLLVLAGIFEVGWRALRGLSLCFFTVACMIVSLGLLGLALRSLPLGTAYAIWTGIGTVGTVAFGTLFLGDLVTAARFLCVGLILAGIVGLKLAT